MLDFGPGKTPASFQEDKGLKKDRFNFHLVCWPPTQTVRIEIVHMQHMNGTLNTEMMQLACNFEEQEIVLQNKIRQSRHTQCQLLLSFVVENNTVVEQCYAVKKLQVVFSTQFTSQHIPSWCWNSTFDQLATVI